LTYSQRNKSKEMIKRIIRTEQNVLYYPNGDQFIENSEITISNFNLNNNLNNEKREVFYDNKFYFSYETIYNYDKDDIIKSAQNIFVKSDSIKYLSNYSYENDNLIKVDFHYTANEKIIDYLTSYFYNEKDKLTKSSYSYTEKYLDSDEYLISSIADFYFDKKERLIKTDWRKSDDSNKNTLLVHKRNRKGLLIRDKEYDKSNNLIKTIFYKYEYDYKGKWIIRKSYENKTKLIKVIHREIQYYD